MIPNKYTKELNKRKKELEEALINQDFSEDHIAYVRTKSQYNGFMEAISILSKALNDDDDFDNE